MKGIRREVVWFAQQMEMVLRKHDPEKGVNGWKDESFVFLFEKLHEEITELNRARAEIDPIKVQKESIDVANVMMFIAWNTTKTRLGHWEPSEITGKDKFFDVPTQWLGEFLREIPTYDTQGKVDYAVEKFKEVGIFIDPPAGKG